MSTEVPEIVNLSDLISKLKETITPEMGPIWFRGHRNKDWNLKPMIFRESELHTEIEYMKKFKQDATLLLESKSYKDFEWLFIMRHYGIPTRLLDWTENPLVAAYFAVLPEDTSSDGAIWILQPLKLNKSSGVVNETLPTFEENSEIMSGYSPDSYNKPSSKNTPMKPIAFLAPRNQPRMQTQLSVFTISHHDEISIEEIGDKSHTWKYIIKESNKEIIRNELELLGISRFQLFPELENIQYKIKEQYNARS